MPRHLPWRILLTAVLAPVPGVCRATSPPALTTLRAVAESFLEPGPHGSVDVEAVVTGGYPNEAILLRDDSAATFAAPANGLAAGFFYHDLVTTEGVVRSCRPTAFAGVVLTLHGAHGPIEVRCNGPLDSDGTARLVDSRVRVTGFGAGEVSPTRQLLRPFVRVVDPAAIEILVPANADPFAAPVVSLDRLASGPAQGHRVTVTGVATAPGGIGAGVFIAADERAVFVAPAAIDDAVRAIRPGDRVEAAGFATAGPVTPFLADAVVRVRGVGRVPVARPLPDVDTATLANAPYLQIQRQIWQDALPIEVEFDIASRHDRDGVAEIAGTTPVKGTHIRGLVSAAVPQAVPGARVRLRGVCRITATRRATFNSFPAAFDVWPASAADVTIIRPAPWLNRPEVVRGVAITLAGCLVAVAAIASWVVLLRRQVRVRSHQLAVDLPPLNETTFGERIRE